MNKLKKYFFYLLLPSCIRDFIKNKHGEVMVSPVRKISFDELGSERTVKNGGINVLKYFLLRRLLDSGTIAASGELFDGTRYTYANVDGAFSLALRARAARSVKHEK